MLLSEEIKKFIPELQFEVIDEKEITSLGQSNSSFENIGVYVSDKKFIVGLKSNVRMVITTKSLGEKCRGTDRGCLLVDNPKEVFWKIHECLVNDYRYARKKFKSVISPDAQISHLAYVAESNVVIEEGVVIEPFVTIYENCYIGRNSVIRSGARIGSTGFQENRVGEIINTITHMGGTVIGEHVDIQNNSCVDKAIFPWDNTIIGNECKIDTLVLVAHSCRIGKNNLIAAGTTLAGKTQTGDNCWIGLGSTVRNGVTIGDNSRVNIGSVVVNDVQPNKEVSGNYAMDHRQFLYNYMRSLELQ